MRRILIDTDCGTDDACAVLLAVRAAQKELDVRVEAITTCAGNVELGQVRPNVLRVLELCDATDIPVYIGCPGPLVEPFRDACYQHGHDGFGGKSNKYPAATVAAPREHAVTAMIRLARQYKGELTVVALGPLTNIALAQKLDPEFINNLRDLSVMGGSCTGAGNDSPGAEFNFRCDPEAMAIVINETKDSDKLFICTFDACKNAAIDWEWYDALDTSNKYISFMKDLMETAANRWRSIGHPGIYLYDMSAMSIVLDPATASGKVVCPVYAELAGTWTRGQMVLDRRSTDRWEHKPNATVVTALDPERLKTMYQRLM